MVSEALAARLRNLDIGDTDSINAMLQDPAEDIVSAHPVPAGGSKDFWQMALLDLERDLLREELLMHGIRPVIPPKANWKEPPACDFRGYKDRNCIERMFNRLKQFRRVATRYDKTRKSFAAFLVLAAVKIWLPHLLRFVSCASVRRDPPRPVKFVYYW